MKINRLDNRTTHRFGDLQVGDVFIECVDGDEYIQMKTDNIDGYNAVSLATGQMYDLENDTCIIKVDAEITIR